MGLTEHAEPASPSSTALEQAVARTEKVDERSAEAIEQLAATSEILRIISRSPGNVQPVFDTIASAALKLYKGASHSFVCTFDGELIHMAAVASSIPGAANAVRAVFPRPPSRETAMARAVLTRSVVAIADVRLDPDFAIGDVTVGAGYRSTLAVPLMRNGQPIGGISVGKPEPGVFLERQIAMLETFADQALIAIENARIVAELEARNREVTESLARQTATGEILSVISRSPTDVHPAFDAIASAALNLCHAELANVFRCDDGLIHLVAVKMRVVDEHYLKAIQTVFPRKPGRDTGAGRAVLTRSIVTIPDVAEDSEYMIGEQTLGGGFRSVLAAPLIRGSEAIGAIVVCRGARGQFPESQVSLLKTFADQAVIAIENGRLFHALQERNRDVTDALARQTATSEILRIISGSPTDVQPVFNVIAEHAVNLCDAEIGVVSRVDGSLLRLAALYGVTREGVDAINRVYPMQISAHTISARAVRERAVIHDPDVLADPGYETKEAARLGRFRGCLGVPMVADGNVVGTIFIGRSAPGSYTERQIELLKTFADQAVIAVQNVQLFKELEARTAQLTRSVDELKALREVGQAISSTLDLEAVLNAIVVRATEITGMDAGALYEYNEAREEFHLHTPHRYPIQLVEALRATPMRKGEGALGRLAVTFEPVQIGDVADETVYQSRVRELLIRLGYRSLLAVPLLWEGRLLGGLVVNRSVPGTFEPEVTELLRTFAAQSALAIQNARLFREVEQKSRELEAASRHKSEFLANMSHELRTPLNAIIGFSEVLAERMFGDVNEKQAEYLSDILESGRHLLSLINDILDLSKIEAGRLELEPTSFDLPTAIDNTLILVRERAQRRDIRLTRQIDDAVGAIDADERKVKQVLLNLLSNALKFTPEGGAVNVRVLVRDGAVAVSVRDTGVGIAPEDCETVFEEFRQVGASSRKAEGTGLGLAISRKLIELHGGKLWLDSVLGEGSTFTFTLPLRQQHSHHLVASSATD
jgi:signal transduction histidine kinase